MLIVTDWPLDPDSFHDVSAEAACAGNDTTVALLEGCTAVVGAATPHGGAVAVWAAWAGLSARLTLQVWRPSTLTLRLDDPTLNLLSGASIVSLADGALPSCNGGGARYQSSRLQLLADGRFDVTPLLGATAAEVAARVAVSGGAALRVHAAAASGGVGRLLLAGTTAGAAEVWLRERPTVRLNLNVSDEAVTIVRLHAAAFSSEASQVSTSLLDAGTGAGDSGSAVRLEVHVQLEQRLRAEGDAVSVVALAHTSDGAVMLVPHAELSVSSATDGLIAAPPAGDGAPWMAAVGLGAAFECGALLAARWASCGVLFAEDTLHVTLDMPTPLRVRITTPAGLQLAHAADLATLPPIGVLSSVSLGVAVDYADATGGGALITRDISADARVALVLVGGGGACVQLAGGGVLAVRANATAGAGCPASVRVAAHVALGRAGTFVSALFEVRLVRFTELSLSYAAHPAGPTILSRLRRIRCTQAYESARPVVVARLSSDVEIDVTESSGFLQMTPAVASLDMARPPSRPLLRAHTVGTATLIATWSGTTTSASISVIDDIVNVNAVSLAVVNASAAAGGGVTLYGVRFSRHATALRVDLDGGVSYSGADAAALDLVSYSSDAPTAVEPGEDGELMLLNNHQRAVVISATTRCAPWVTGLATVVANLQAGFRGVDLGANNGLQFQMGANGVLDVPVSVSAAGVRLASFQIVVHFEASLLLAEGWSEGVTPASLAATAFPQPTVTLNDPVDEVLLVGNTDGASAPGGGLVQLASLHLRRQASGVAFIGGTVVGLITCVVCDGSDDEDGTELGPISAGAGFADLSGRRSRRASDALDASDAAAAAGVPARVAWVAERRARRKAAAEATCCDGALALGRFYGDTNGDCAFDIKDVRRASLSLLAAGAAAIALPTQYGGAGLCEWQQQQLDPTLDGRFQQNDVVYLLLALAKKYRFVAAVEGSGGGGGVLRLGATLYDHASAPADSAQARLELELRPAGATSAQLWGERPHTKLGLLHDGMSLEGNWLARAAALGGGAHALELSEEAPAGAPSWWAPPSWSSQPLEAALMIETVDALGGSDVTRRVPFHGSSAPGYAAQGYSFAPLLRGNETVGRELRASPPAFPPALPGDVPQLPPPPPLEPTPPSRPPATRSPSPPSPAYPPALPGDVPQLPPPPPAPPLPPYAPGGGYLEDDPILVVHLSTEIYGRHELWDEDDQYTLRQRVQQYVACTGSDTSCQIDVNVTAHPDHSRRMRVTSEMRMGKYGDTVNLIAKSALLANMTLDELTQQLWAHAEAPVNMSYWWLNVDTGEGGTCPGPEWQPHGRRCYRKLREPMGFAACARTCAEQHGATLPCISAERDKAVLGAGGGWVGHWSLAGDFNETGRTRRGLLLGRDDVGWSTCDAGNWSWNLRTGAWSAGGEGDTSASPDDGVLSSSDATWARFEPDAGLLGDSCEHEDCAVDGSGRNGRRDVPCNAPQPCVCAWPSTLVSIQNNYVVVEAEQAEGLLAALPTLEARVGNGAARCVETDRRRDLVLAACVPLLLLLSLLPWRRKLRAWRRRRMRSDEYELTSLGADEDEVVEYGDRQRLLEVVQQRRYLQETAAQKQRLENKLQLLLKRIYQSKDMSQWREDTGTIAALKAETARLDSTVRDATERLEGALNAAREAAERDEESPGAQQLRWVARGFGLSMLLAGGIMWTLATRHPGVSPVPEIAFGAALVAPGGLIVVGSLKRTSSSATRLLSALLWLAGLLSLLDTGIFDLTPILRAETAGGNWRLLGDVYELHGRSQYYGALLWPLLPMLGEVLQLRWRSAGQAGSGTELVWAIPPNRARWQLREMWCAACLLYGLVTVAIEASLLREHAEYEDRAIGRSQRTWLLLAPTPFTPACYVRLASGVVLMLLSGLPWLYKSFLRARMMSAVDAITTPEVTPRFDSAVHTFTPKRWNELTAKVNADRARVGDMSTPRRYSVAGVADAAVEAAARPRPPSVASTRGSARLTTPLDLNDTSASWQQTLATMRARKEQQGAARLSRAVEEVSRSSKMPEEVAGSTLALGAIRNATDAAARARAERDATDAAANRRRFQAAAGRRAGRLPAGDTGAGTGAFNEVGGIGSRYTMAGGDPLQLVARPRRPPVQTAVAAARAAAATQETRTSRRSGSPRAAAKLRRQSSAGSSSGDDVPRPDDVPSIHGLTPRGNSAGSSFTLEVKTPPARQPAGRGGLRDDDGESAAADLPTIPVCTPRAATEPRRQGPSAGTAAAAPPRSVPKSRPTWMRALRGAASTPLLRGEAEASFGPLGQPRWPSGTSLARIAVEPEPDGGDTPRDESPTPFERARQSAALARARGGSSGGRAPAVPRVSLDGLAASRQPSREGYFQDRLAAPPPSLPPSAPSTARGGLSGRLQRSASVGRLGKQVAPGPDDQPAPSPDDVPSIHGLTPRAELPSIPVVTPRAGFVQDRMPALPKASSRAKVSRKLLKRSPSLASIQVAPPGPDDQPASSPDNVPTTHGLSPRAAAKLRRQNSTGSSTGDADSFKK